MISILELYQLFQQASGISTDSRKVEEGFMFFALKGDRFDGNLFANQVLEKGAAYAIVDDPDMLVNKQMILVDNVLETLQALARHHRQQLNIPLIAITGSNGKTTTKELMSTILDSHYRTHFTKGNFNNHIGVPLTLLSMPMDAEVAVIEMGANHVGEIAFLCNIAEPTHGLITNVGKAHLEGFGSFEGVKKAKSELYNYLASHEGVAFVNLDEPFLKDLAAQVTRKVFYHKSDHPDPEIPMLETKLLGTSPSIRLAFLSDLRDNLVEAQSNLFGSYNFNNLQTAISIGRYFKVPSKRIKAAVEQYISTNNRSQLLKEGTNTFILDAYNANPTSMRIALDHLASSASETKIAIIGDMLELGTYSQEEHLSIIKHAMSKSFDQVILVGAEFGLFREKIQDVSYFEDVTALRAWFNQQNIENSLILLKGSRGIRLEQLLQAD